MSKPVQRTVRHRRFASEIKRLRDDAGLSQGAAAELVGVNRTTWNEWEQGKSTPHRGTLTRACEKLGASEAKREELLALAKRPQGAAWMRPLRGALPDAYGAYIDLESGAQSTRWWQPLLIPGLLQTERYARDHASRARPDATPAQIEARVTARMERQAAFMAREAPLWAVIGEAALRCEVGGPGGLREQLARLLDASSTPNVTIQVMPFRAGACASMMASFGILHFPNDPPVVYQESPGGDLFFEMAEDLRTFRATYDHLQATALSPADSGRLINDAIQELERREVHEDGSRVALA